MVRSDSERDRNISGIFSSSKSHKWNEQMFFELWSKQRRRRLRLPRGRRLWRVFFVFLFAGCVTFSMLFISPQQGSRSSVVISERPAFLQRESVYKGKKKTNNTRRTYVFLILPANSRAVHPGSEENWSDILSVSSVNTVWTIKRHSDKRQWVREHIVVAQRGAEFLTLEACVRRVMPVNNKSVWIGQNNNFLSPMFF